MQEHWVLWTLRTLKLIHLPLRECSYKVIELVTSITSSVDGHGDLKLYSIYRFLAAGEVVENITALMFLGRRTGLLRSNTNILLWLNTQVENYFYCL